MIIDDKELFELDDDIEMSYEDVNIGQPFNPSNSNNGPDDYSFDLESNRPAQQPQQPITQPNENIPMDELFDLEDNTNPNTISQPYYSQSNDMGELFDLETHQPIDPQQGIKRTSEDTEIDTLFNLESNKYASEVELQSTDTIESNEIDSLFELESGATNNNETQNETVNVRVEVDGEFEERVPGYDPYNTDNDPKIKELFKVNDIPEEEEDEEAEEEAVKQVEKIQTTHEENMAEILQIERENIEENFKRSDDIIAENVDKKLKFLIANEELRRKKERERVLNLERIRNESFQKKLEKLRTEMEYKELKKQTMRREVRMLEIENEKMRVDEGLLNEIRENAVQMLKDKETTNAVDDMEFDEGAREEHELEAKKRELAKNLAERKRSIKAKNDEITRIINLSEINK